MGKRTSYEPGTFCWTDLATTDPEGAKAFYGALFGWEAVDRPSGDAGTYAMFRLGGDEVCAVYDLEPERREMDIPPHWLSYVSVESADATAKRAEELGGESFAGAFDIPEMGRIAVVRDPGGAVLAAWEPGEHVGADVVNDAGSMTWNELQSREPEKAAAFYADLFGWTTEPIEQDGETVYVTIQNSGSINGGVMPMAEAQGDAPPYWIPYFTVASCDESAANVESLGGRVLTGPMDLPAGRIAVFMDPQGAAFAVFEGDVDD